MPDKISPRRITSVQEIIRQRGKNFQIIAADGNLSEFLLPGGDYTFWLDHPDTLTTSCGGNATYWTLQPDGDVLLQFQHGARWRTGELKEPGTLVPLTVLWEVIRKLGRR